HLALASDDILATAARMRALGLAVLPIPANYYADLAARFELDESLLARLQQFNVLYDRDADGEFFHFFSRAFGKRFFFEIVQRKGYSAYAAGNVAIRLAAQSRYRDDPPSLPPLSR
ncbi:MAG TPA: hypothetical protein VMF64_07495, partial [Steroidobacteraceae bacterium]|nr:hypothetical protein [Steroidobacteraceae bacterium]